MKKYVIATILFLCFCGVALTPLAQAITPPPLAGPPGLSLVEIKITGSEYIMIQNNTGATISSSEMSSYWLYDFNGQDPSVAGVSSSSQQLPAASLANGQTMLLSADGGATCGAAVTAKLSISLTDTGGFLEIVRSSFSGGVLIQTAGDSVSWNSSSSGASSAAASITVPTSTSLKTSYADYRFLNSPSYWWQPATTGATICDLSVSSSTVNTSSLSQLLPGTAPPVSFVDSTGGQIVSSNLPAADIGLQAPIVNEILPNPADPDSDDEDEYIEIYNSNDTTFDLSGFKLQVGTSTTHTYTLPDGTSLPAKGFVAFFSIDTKLALSNGGGQARLLDPDGNIISQTEVYGTAKEGQAWAYANGSWYWTTKPTPNAANIISSPLSTKVLSVGSASAKKAAAKSSGKVKSAKTQKTANPNLASVGAAKTGSIHPMILAGVGAGAVGYAAYEYRHDLANRLYQLRRYRKNR